MRDESWGLGLEAAVCEACDWSYLVPQDNLPLKCPHCFAVDLSPVESRDGLSDDYRPELILPYRVAPDSLAQDLQDFAKNIWFAPRDLNSQNLKARLQRIYLPMWLVDSQVQATWQAEAGFNYEAISHRDKYNQNQGGWVSQRVTETRVRWEPRLGRLNRSYDNITAPALEQHQTLRRQLGPYKLEAARPYQADMAMHSFVRLPNRSPADAWPEAVPALQTTAADECRRACRADHWRDFRWTASYDHHHWTLLLLPLYTTYYLDDEQHPQQILINGQTGFVSGSRRASMRRAQRVALVIAVIAIIIFVLSLIVGIASIFVPRLLIIAGVGLITAFIVGLLAILPVAIAWQFNRTGNASAKLK